MTKKSIDKKNRKKFPLKKLTKNWPFSVELARDIYSTNEDGYYSSFKEFLIINWLAAQDSESVYTLKISSDSDYELSNEKVDSWPLLKYSGFFIEKNILYFEESINKTTKIYSLNDIPYQTIILEAIRFYTHISLQTLIKEDEDYKKSYRKGKIWLVLFLYILLTKYSFSIKNLLIEENYLTMYKEEMISVSYSVFGIINKSDYYLDILLDTEEEILRERLKNLFTFSNISTNQGEKLIDTFLSTKSLNEIISHNKKNF